MSAPTLGTLPQGPLTAAFKREIENSLTEIVPPGKRGALLVVVDKAGTQLHVAAALDNDGDWKLAGSAGTTWSGDVSGKILLSGAW